MSMINILRKITGWVLIKETITCKEQGDGGINRTSKGDAKLDKSFMYKIYTKLTIPFSKAGVRKKGLLRQTYYRVSKITYLKAINFYPQK